MRIAVWLILSAAISLAGCAAGPLEPYLRWESRPASAPAQGRVAIKEVVNERPANHGASDSSNVGNIRSITGVPEAIHVDDPSGPFKFEPQPLDKALVTFVNDGLTAAGIGTTGADDASATARVVIEIHEFWVDMTSDLDRYVATVSLDLVVEDPVTGQVRATLRVHGEGDASPGRHAGRQDLFAKRAYQRALDQAYESLVSGLAPPAPARAALITPPNAAPAAPVASTSTTGAGARTAARAVTPTGAIPAPGASCPPEQIVTDKTDGHCCWAGQIWANDRCNGRPGRCPRGQGKRGDTCVDLTAGR